MMHVNAMYSPGNEKKRVTRSNLFGGSVHLFLLRGDLPIQLADEGLRVFHLAVLRLFGP